MKLELEQADIQAIAEKVTTMLRPVLAANKPVADELLTTEQLAAFLHVDTGWIYKNHHDKQIPHIKIGKELRFKRSQIEKWLLNRSVQFGTQLP